MDLNGVYYPVYESSFSDHWAGRCPLTDEEVKQLSELTGLDFGRLNSWTRTQPAQISFDRPEESPCLDVIRNDKEKYKKAVSILKEGRKRLKETPRGDIEKDLIPCEKHQGQLRKYAVRLEENLKSNCSIAEGDKYYDPK